MALAPDATGSVNTGAVPSATPNWSHTCTGSNLALFVMVAWNTASSTISSVTYNNVAMSLVSSSSGSSGSNQTAIYKLAGPTTGANNAKVTFNQATSCIATSISFTGADQTSPNDGANNNTASSNAPSTSVTTVANNDYVVDILLGASSFAITIGAGQTAILTDTANSGGGFHVASSRLTNVKTPAGSVAMTWSLGNTETWVQSVAAVRPVQAAATATSSTLQMMGV